MSIESNQEQYFRNPTGLVRIPSSSVRVEDPEEEVFLLYTQLSSRQHNDASSSSFTGLGSVDSRQDALTVRFTVPTPRPTPSALESSEATRFTHASGVKRKEKRSYKLGSHTEEDRVLEIELAQDKTALRSKRGDTASSGGVVLGQALLNDLCSESPDSVFDPEKLKDCNVLELGAGTGLLSLIFTPWVRHYTVTDLGYLVPLIRKNIATNLSVVQQTFKPARREPLSSSSSKRTKRSAPPIDLRGSENEIMNGVTVDSLDWLELQRATPHVRRTSFRFEHADPPDLIVIADCVYNPSLLPALLATIDYIAVHGQTCVLVAVELRAADVVQEFLHLWLALGSWEIWRVGSRCRDIDVERGGDDDGWLGVDYAVWIGWKCT